MGDNEKHTEAAIRGKRLADMGDSEIPDIVAVANQDECAVLQKELQQRGFRVVRPEVGEPPERALIREEIGGPPGRVIVVTTDLHPTQERGEWGASEPTARFSKADSQLSGQFIKGGWLPPIMPPKDTEVAGCVTSDGVSLRTLVQWAGSTDMDPFVHQEEVHVKCVTTFTNHCRQSQGNSWGYRTPIVHAALAGLDVTDAGFDEAAARALMGLETYMSVKRGDIPPGSRLAIGAMMKRRYNPMAVLLRAALMWYGLLSEHGSEMKTSRWYLTGVHNMPAKLDSVETLNGMCNEVTNAVVDIVYVRVQAAAEVFMLDVLSALISDEYPFRHRLGAAALWPAMNNPRVAYNAPYQFGRMGSHICAAHVWETMQRYCSIWDCHDLWAIALNTVQSFGMRRIDAGWLAGSHRLYSYWPTSDLQACLLGPFISGITPEGMKTVPFPPPDIRHFQYGAAVKGIMLSAAYMQVMQEMHEAHPVALATGTGIPHRLNKYLTAEGALTLAKERVGPLLKQAGWDFMDDGLASIGLGVTRDVLKAVLDVNKVPWWINVIRHLTDAGKALVMDWLTPAVPTQVPDPGEWNLYTHIGSTTEGQVAAAVMWANATVRYRVEMPNGSIRVVQAPEFKWGSFPPRMTPKFVYGRCRGDAALRFNASGLKRLKLMRKLRKSEIEVFPLHSGDQWLITGAILEDVDPSGTVDDVTLMLQMQELRDMGLLTDDDIKGHDITFDKDKAKSVWIQENAERGAILSKLERLAQLGVLDRAEHDKFAAEYDIYSPDRTSVAGLLANRLGSALDITTKFANVERGKRLEAAQVSLSIMQDLAGITGSEKYKQNNHSEAVGRLVAAIQAFKKDDALTMEELGGVPDRLARYAGETKYITKVAIRKGLERGITASEALQRMMADIPVDAAGLVDDPTIPDQTPQDFGEGTSSQGLAQETSPSAGGADVIPESMPTLGFAPPPE